MKKLLLITLLALPLMATTTVTDGTRTCTVGSTTPCNLLAVSGTSPASVTITSSGASTFALASGSAGTLTTVNSTTATYTPPSHVVNKHQIGGCPVFANDSIFNTDIYSAPVNSNSSTWLSQYTGTYGSNYLSFGNDMERLINYATSSTPTRTFQVYDVLPTSTQLTQPWDPNRQVEGGRDVGVTYTGAYGYFTDHHVLSVTTQSGATDCTANETYLPIQKGSYLHNIAPPTANCHDGSTAGCDVYSASQYPLLSYVLGNTYTTQGLGASGIPEFASDVSLYELKSGHINHVARIVLQTYAYQAANIWPAPSNALGCTGCSSNMYLGSWARLKASYWNGTGNAPTCNSGVSAVDTLCNTLVTQQQHYGGIVADGGGALLGASADISADPNAVKAVAEFSLALNSTNYEFIDVSGAEPSLTGTSSMQVNPSGTITPSQYAVVNVTPSGGSASPVPIFLQGIGVGIAQTQLNIPTSSTYQLAPWVEPSTASQVVNWTRTSGVGTVTSGGLYTAPSTSSGLTYAVLTGTASADSSSTVTVYVTVYPYGSDGTLRFAGWPTGSNAVDATSGTFTWYSCCLTYGLNYVLGPGYMPTSVSTEAAVYNNPVDAYGSDLTLQTVLPNGNYQVRMLWSVPGYAIGCSYNQCGSITPTQQVEFVPYNIEMNGLQQKGWLNTFTLSSTCPWLWDCPVSTIVPAKVTNGYLTIRELAEASDVYPYRGGGNGPKKTHLAGIQISPDTSTTAHLVVDLSGNSTSIASGQTINPLAITDWYTGVNPASTTWSITNDPWGGSGFTTHSSVSSNGVVTAGTGTVPTGQPLVVTATNGSYSASITLYTAGTSYLLNSHQ